MSWVREATAADRDAIVAMFGRAFENDPVSAWLNLDPKERASQMEASYRWVFDDAASGMRLTTAACEAASLWVFSAASDRAAAAQAGGDKAPTEELPSERRMRMMMESLQVHKPDGDFWHLELAGCEPASQGKGLGAAVVGAGLDRISGHPAYLETANPANLGFYRMLGFSVREEWDVGENGPHYWSMIRVDS
jgi:hypothetical protein